MSRAASGGDGNVRDTSPPTGEKTRGSPVDGADGTRLFLAIETSTGFGSVAVGGVRGTLAEVGLSGPGTLSAKLIPAANEALRLAGVRKSELGALAVGAGPGSFTGIRLAAATAKGIARALHLPVLAYSSLLVIAANAWAYPGEVCVLEDARGRDVYTARYRMEPEIGTLDAPAVMTIDEVVDRWSGLSRPLLIGSGAVRHRDELEGAGLKVADQAWAAPRAAALLWLAGRIPDAGRIEDPAGWEPGYLRASGAERIAVERGRAL
ncbi:MAG: tRNA (adenosine(37)-N6)-threonylcarbamoyltransferase complex dimerization subunit type 1 TsaB [Gemmatimonadota bacterium]|jgi:tRNA threonylcarbamoyladenosine biosynthesis protein TsaB|nr:tRNA (adenosine(37)-N6)-threonylcarbamoyltransferase complex dimerization subunit type 1 TsaB [Gemmatimonadota bacterium]